MYTNTWKKSLWKIWTEFGQNLDEKVGRIKEKIFSGNLNDSILVKFLIYRRLFELSESLNVLSDNNFHLKNCMNIQFHRYNNLKYQFVWKYNKKITMENFH